MTERTDPLAALARFHCQQPMPDGSPCGGHVRSAQLEIDRLREQGYVLVSAEGLARALCGPLFHPVRLKGAERPCSRHRRSAAAILSALAAEEQPEARTGKP